MRPTILALDLEGTLISNAVSQIPRPGLYQFLDLMSLRFDRLVMFTTVPEPLFRRIARLLVDEKHAPTWFETLDYIVWSGSTKDLRLVSEELGRSLLLDDHLPYVHEGQQPWWVEVPLFGAPYEDADRGLELASNRIDLKLRELG